MSVCLGTRHKLKSDYISSYKQRFEYFVVRIYKHVRYIIMPGRGTYGFKNFLQSSTHSSVSSERSKSPEDADRSQLEYLPCLALYTGMMLRENTPLISKEAWPFLSTFPLSIFCVLEHIIFYFYRT